MTIIIQCDGYSRVIRPGDWTKERFDGSVSKLVEAMTGSDLKRGIKNFKFYDYES